MDIVRFDTREHDGYLSREVLGLNIFSANCIEFEPDPRLVLLRALAEDYCCAAHIDWEQLTGTTAETPEEYARGDYAYVVRIGKDIPIVGKHAYERIPIGIYPGEFWYADEELRYGFWVPQVSAGDLTPEISDYTWYDSLALYFDGCRDGIRFDPHITKPDPPDYIAFHDYWIRRCLQWFGLICTTQYDGWYPEAYAESELKFSMLQRGIDLAISAVQSSDWYQANRENLYWDEGELCLKLK